MPKTLNSALLYIALATGLTPTYACVGLLEPLPGQDSSTGGTGGSAPSGGVRDDGGTAGGTVPLGGGGVSIPDAAGSAGAAGEEGNGTDLVLAYPGSGAVKGFNASVANHNNGHQFEVTETGVTVTDLGVWDYGADGLVGPHTVSLFALDKIGAGAVGTPVPGGTVKIPAGVGSTIESGYRFQPLEKPIELAPGPYAVVAYGLNALDPYGDGGNIPMPKTGVRDALYDPFEVSSRTWPDFPKDGDTNRHASASFHFLSRNGKFLKIMPLGDSMTVGTGSVAGSGYRLPLAVLLQAKEVDFQFVGSMASDSGKFLAREQVQHEGHVDAAIADFPDHKGIIEGLPTYLGAASTTPDVILLLIGTNDIHFEYEVAEAPNRVDALLESIRVLAPNARVIVSSLPPIQDPTEDARIVAFNSALSSITQKHRAAGQSVTLVDMHQAIGPKEMADMLNPNDAGYARMAQIWADAILSQ